MNYKLIISYIKVVILTLCTIIPIFCAKKPIYKSEKAPSDIKSPALMQRIEPFYPPEARAKGMQGPVQLSLLINIDGKVEKVRMTNSSGYDILDKAAQQYARSLSFIPAERAGQPINVWLSWTVNYSLILYKYPFDPHVYVYKMQELIADSEKRSVEAQNNIYKQILDLHGEYINHVRQNPESNLSKYLNKYLNPQILKQWQVFITEWPLTFIVLHDLVTRFPESKNILNVEELLVTLAEEDVKRILLLTDSASSQSLKLRNEFFKALHEFLQDNYPQYLKGYLKEVLEENGIME